MVSSAWVEHVDRLDRIVAFEALVTSQVYEVVPAWAEEVGLWLHPGA